MGLKRKVDLTPIWDKAPRKRDSNPHREYKKLVWSITEINCITLKDISLRSFKTHHIDHKISIWDGYHLGIKVELIAHIDNLRIIDRTINGIKGRKSLVDEQNQWIWNTQTQTKINK